MPFNSLVFLLLVLPATVAVHAVCARLGPRWRLGCLVVLSFAFYGWFDLRFVPLLAGSVLANWILADLFLRTRRPAWIALAIGLDLLVLGLFKYLDFLVDLLDRLPDVALPAVSLALPLGVSFFTFQHIAYLVDLRRGKAARMGLLDYALYVAFFPRVIAGPLQRPSQFVEALAAPRPRDDAAKERAARALLLLTGGLAKKVLIGDTLGSYVDPIFAAASVGRSPSLPEAWQAMLGYTAQLYFDFSGYTDMALGIALLVGIVLPPNFDAPYRAVSIQDFWRRWHMTLSFFLRDYLYIPMGGSRHGLPRQLLALFATMALGGLWHGAGLTFVLWGTLHGIALGGHVLWRKAGLAIPTAVGWLATFAFVALTWVLFRAPDFASAGLVYAGLADAASWHDGIDVRFWALVIGALLVATFGPTMLAAATRMPLTPWIAAAAALLLAVVLLKVGDDANHSFIYAKF